MPLIPALERQKQRDLSSRSVWSTECVPRHPGLHRETLSQTIKKKEPRRGHKGKRI